MSQMVPLGVMLLLQKFDLEEGGYLVPARIAYVVVQIICIGTWCMVYMTIQKMEDDGVKLKIPEVKTMGQVAKPACEQTKVEYDTSKWKEMMQQLCMGFLIVGGMHYKWGYTMPLVMQVVMTPLQLFENPLLQIHVFGKAAVGDLKRPFPTPNPFGLPTPPAANQEEKEDESEVRDVKTAISIDKLVNGSSLGITFSFSDLKVEKWVPEAADAGWAVGDKIVEVGDTPVKTKEEFLSALAETKKTLPFDISVIRRIRVPKAALKSDGEKKGD